MSKQSDSIGDQIYGYIGPFPSLRTVAAAVLIVCRLLWPIFVYQPLGLPGIADAPCKKSPLTYSPAALRYNDDAKQNRPILYYELRLSRWVATISSALSESAEDSCNAPHDNAVVQQYFDTSNVGFLDAGIAALEWVRKNSPSAFASLSSKVGHTSRYLCNAFLLCSLRIMSLNYQHGTANFKRYTRQIARRLRNLIFSLLNSAPGGIVISHFD